MFTHGCTCAERNNQQGPCEHDDEARVLGIWVTVELNKAQELLGKVCAMQ